MSVGEHISVQVVCAWPDRAYSIRVSVPGGMTAGQLVEHCRVMERFPEFERESVDLAVFGRVIEPDYVLLAGDRVELLRPLLNDPKETRRKRAAQTARKRS
jgi:uncharacterized protein